MDAAPLHRAKTYPYPIPDRSYVHRDGFAEDITEENQVPDLRDRVPVLAVGSNQSPQQLTRKFRDGDWGAIPVLRIHLDGFDSVYSPHIATYGAIAATLQEAPGVRVTLFVTWLTERQLGRMHETEISSANYGFGRLGGLRVTCEVGPPLDSFYIYNSTRGTLCRDGTPIPVAEIPARGRAWTAMNQTQVQHHVRDRLAPGKSLDEFIHESIADADLRRQRSDTLKEGARAFTPADFEPISI